MDSALLPRVKSHILHSEEKEPVIYQNKKLIVSWDLLNPVGKQIDPGRTTVYPCPPVLSEERKEVRITPPPNPPNACELF